LFFTETVATPYFLPIAGSYIGAQDVIIRCDTEGATIYYTTDGTEPLIDTDSIQGIVYSSPITIGETAIVKAVAVKTGMKNSEVATAFYTIEFETIATPTFLPIAGIYTEAIDVTINCTTDGATVYYSIDGSEPINENGVIQGFAYSSPITIGETTMVKAVAVKPGMYNSNTATGIYTIDSTITSVSSLDFKKINIYPNPVQEYFMIEGVEENCLLIVYSLIGDEMLQLLYNPGDRVDIGFLETGIYLVRIGNMIGKLTKNR
jgi:hypothetical protein